MFRLLVLRACLYAIPAWAFLSQRFVESLQVIVANGLLELNNQQTYNNVAKWLEELRQHTNPNIVTMLVANKSILQDCAEEAKQFASV